ncbi:hypothetical protein Gogos_021287, partial [Gossypium gossypioides]|nr:hypothetical protein [Gossypium gossypioides]
SSSDGFKPFGVLDTGSRITSGANESPLKRKKKVLVGKSMVVYARFKYEKLSLFCFICGKLGHGESYCPLRLTIDSSKIVFGWDLSLCAVVRR